MTRCDQSTRDDLKAFCDNELPLARRVAVRRHLAGCESCRKEVAAMEGISNDLRTSESATGTLDPGLREKLLATVAEHAPRVETPQMMERPRKTKLVWATCGVLFIGFAIVRTAYVHTNSPQFSMGQARYEETGNNRFLPQNVETVRPAAPATVTTRSDDASRQNQVEIPALDGSAIFGKPRPAAVAGGRPVGLQATGGKSDVALSWNSSSGATAYDVKRSTGSGSGYATADSPAPALSETGDDPLRRVHKEGSLSVEVANPEASGEEVEKRVRTVGGFVATNDLTTGDDGTKTAQMVVKVPVLQFESMVQQITKLGEVKAKNITGEDITEKVSDADQRESVLEDETRRAEALLKLKGKKSTWREQEDARDVRIQLAQARARLHLLKKMADLSTITLTLTQKSKPVPAVATGFVPDMKATTLEALNSVIGAAASLLSFVIWIVAYAPIWLPAIFVGRYFVREYRKRNADARA